MAERRFGGAAPPKSFLEAIGTCFSKYVDFDGRASRSEYWYFQLFLFALFFMTSMVNDVAFAIAAFGALLPAWAVGARRLHDANMSGWRQMLTVIPLVGLLVIYWMCKGPVEPNDYNG